VKHTEQTRKVIVQSVEIKHLSQDDPFFPKYRFEPGTELPPEIWLVCVSFRDGMKPKDSTTHICRSKQEADELTATFKVGGEMKSFVQSLWDTLGLDVLRDSIDRGFVPMMGPDEDRYLVWQTLVDAEVLSENGVDPSSRVLQFLGQERVDKLRLMHPENWTAAAEFEFCWQNYHHSSAVFIAAACNFKYYIEQDEYAAGYLLRDLEILVHGVEAEATKAQEMRQRAGGAGGKTSSVARNKRRTDLFEKIEALASRSPDMVRLGPETIVRIALEDCERDNPALWSQGKGQAQEYLGEIRRGEAGNDMKARYHAQFVTKPPKQF
jgi:hypothetical protein